MSFIIDQSVMDQARDMTQENILNCGVLTECGAACVDTFTDLAHCGACQQRCVVNNGRGICSRGRCEVLSCDLDYYDFDQNSVNGCETFDTCVQGQNCITACQSTGVSQCNGGISECRPPAERCSLQDDDCDGRCDEEDCKSWLSCRCTSCFYR